MFFLLNNTNWKCLHSTVHNGHTDFQMDFGNPLPQLTSPNAKNETDGSYFRVLLLCISNGRCKRAFWERKPEWVGGGMPRDYWSYANLADNKPHNFYPSRTRQTLFTIANFISHLAWISNKTFCILWYV